MARHQDANASWTQARQQTLEAIDFREYYITRLSGVTPVGNNGQALAICPFHGDTKGSLSINLDTGLWNCKGCAEKGDIFDFHSRTNNLGGFKPALISLAGMYGVTLPDQPAAARGGEKRTKKASPATEGKTAKDVLPSLTYCTPPAPAAPAPDLPGEEELDKLHAALLNHEKNLSLLMEQRLVNLETIKKYQIGFSASRTRITIPVRNEQGVLVGVRCYSGRAEQKMISWSKGSGASALFGLDELTDAVFDPDFPIIICEGEWDRLLLRQAGFQAVTATNGSMAFRREFAPYFQGLDVVLVYDADGVPPDPKGETTLQRAGTKGRGGAANTAKILAGVARSIKILDLQAAGLVAGTEQDNDITDLARRRPEDWAEALKAALAKAEELPLSQLAGLGADAAPGGISDDFVRLYEDSGGVWKPTKNGSSMIANFTLKPLRRIKLDDPPMEVLEAQVLFPDEHPGTTRHSTGAVTFWPAHWATKNSFRRAIGDLAAGWKGSEDDIQELKVLLSTRPCPRYRGESKLGLHYLKDQKKWALVATDKTITSDGEIEDLVFWSDQANRTKYEISEITIPSNVEVADMFRDIQRLNHPSVIGAILAWSFSLPFKGRLRRAVPACYSQFPVLMCWGNQGAGKTKTIAALTMRLYNRAETDMVKVDDATKWSLMVAAASTNLIPIVYDEYKPTLMALAKSNEISAYIRTVYDGLEGQRGHLDQSGILGTRAYSYTAPSVILGEHGMIEPAIKERIIEVTMSTSQREGCIDIGAMLPHNIPGMGFRFLKWSLGVTDDEVRACFTQEFQSVDKVFKDRPRQNMATIRMGLRMLQRFLDEEIGYALPVGMFIESMETAQKENIYGEGVSVKSAIDQTLESMATMAIASESEKLRRGVDYKVEGDRLMLRIQTIFPKWSKWSREHGFGGEKMDESSFKKRLSDQSYYMGKSTVWMKDFSDADIPRKCKVHLVSVIELCRLKIDLSGFGVEFDEDEFQLETPF